MSLHRTGLFGTVFFWAAEEADLQILAQFVAELLLAIIAIINKHSATN